MQKIIQINISGRVIPIEEDAYRHLNDYLTSLAKHFSGEQGKDEIIQDIENRIAELFTTRLDNGAPAIDREDVMKVVETLGRASDFNEDEYVHTTTTATLPGPYTGGGSHSTNDHYTRRLFRNPNDKMLGGVCSGVANYFGIDPVIVRLVFAILFLTAGIGIIAYILAWIIIPVAKTKEDMAHMTGKPMDFDTFKRNLGEELQDLKKKGEEMSQELKDFFNKKK